MIEVSGLAKEFGPLRAIEDVSFRVARGCITGFLGSNGAGKTTTMRILAGVFPPSRGRARVAGFDVTAESLEARRRLGYFAERAPAYPEATVREYLGFVVRVKEGEPEEVDEVLDACGLRAFAKRLIGNLSRGTRQRVALAQALLGDPEVLILDEPTAGLDPEQAAHVRSLIRSFAGAKTVLFSSHQIGDVSAICDDVVVIDHGRTLVQDTPEGLRQRARCATLEESFLAFVARQRGTAR